MLTKEEEIYLIKKLGRNPNLLEIDMIDAEWSEHCSYKSSKKYVRSLPSRGKRVIVGPGYDAGVLDIGDDDVITVHIESHNHPSAVEPYGGAATGVGGVIRDIISMGTRPIALLDALRFSSLDNQNKTSKSKWLFKNVVKGIADYGNCIGIPTVGGDIEFDNSFKDYCLVDVAAIGLGKRDQIISNHAEEGDLIVLAGNPTGKDGIRGASFASKLLDNEEDRSAVQIPDPFLEKLLIEATIEATNNNCINATKDLGGGGLSCCLSELSHLVEKGFEIELSAVHTKVTDISPNEIMISESQERMIYIINKERLSRFTDIFTKFGVTYSIIGKVSGRDNLKILYDGKPIANISCNLMVKAPLSKRKARKPDYLNRSKSKIELAKVENYNDILLCLLANPNIGNKDWVYQQYDHEVGLRTVLKPGADASVIRVNDNKFVSIKLDGNSKQCYLDPYQGMLGCLSEACRNVVCTGAQPIGIIDHLQFGSPENSQIYWTFIKSINAIVDFCKYMKIPVVGGKVSFYNETMNSPIKPSPVIGTIGLIKNRSHITNNIPIIGNALFVLGQTSEELGGSEYFDLIDRQMYGNVPKLDLKTDKKNRLGVLDLIEKGLIDFVHDCSKGGIATALAELAILGNLGIKIDLKKIPNNCSRHDYLLFSESHSRFIIGTRRPDRLKRILSRRNCIFSEIGKTDPTKTLNLHYSGKEIINLSNDNLIRNYNAMNVTMDRS
ncbi:MAG TPA: phosphoribosylformylglycinamidine synthase subunit PurL [Nitrososphaeraceae archaeon]|nr:phosphoribosylformylglycinamidine synthase subunit PurL [Nitrososphaeraceae archaeon]